VKNENAIPKQQQQLPKQHIQQQQQQYPDDGDGTSAVL